MGVGEPIAVDAGASQVAAAFDGDQAFVDLVEGDLARIQRLALLLAGTGDEGRDLVAEAVARTLPRWRDGHVDDPGAYLRRIVVNLAGRRWRRRALSRDRDHYASGWWTIPEEVEATVVDRDRTLRAMMRLPLRRRTVVVLRYYEDLPLDHIATVMGTSVGTVKSQLARALEQLRRELKEATVE